MPQHVVRWYYQPNNDETDKTMKRIIITIAAVAAAVLSVPGHANAAAGADDCVTSHEYHQSLFLGTSPSKVARTFGAKGAVVWTREVNSVPQQIIAYRKCGSWGEGRKVHVLYTQLLPGWFADGASSKRDWLPFLQAWPSMAG